MTNRLPFTDIPIAADGGHRYYFRILEPGEWPPMMAGIYAFAKITTIGAGISLANPRIEIGYFGRSDTSLRERLDGHERFADGMAWGATHIAVLKVPGWSDHQRADLESQLIRRYNPPLNKQHAPSADIDFAAILGCQTGASQNTPVELAFNAALSKKPNLSDSGLANILADVLNPPQTELDVNALIGALDVIGTPQGNVDINALVEALASISSPVDKRRNEPIDWDWVLGDGFRS